MNLLLFHPSERNRPLPYTDRRVRQLREVLRVPEGESFAAGEINGDLGRAEVEAWSGRELHWRFIPHPGLSPPLPSITLAIGLSRPQTMRRILQEGTALGCSRFLIFPAQRSEPSYGQSSLWRTLEWQERILAGVEQAFTTRVPELRWCSGLAEAWDIVVKEQAFGSRSVVLDNYEASESLPGALASGTGREGVRSYVVWVGPERGWGAGDREIFRKTKGALWHIGPRVLRVETALLVAQGQLLADLNYWTGPTPSVTKPG